MMQITYRTALLQTQSQTEGGIITGVKKSDEQFADIDSAIAYHGNFMMLIEEGKTTVTFDGDGNACNCQTEQ